MTPEQLKLSAIGLEAENAGLRADIQELNATKDEHDKALELLREIRDDQVNAQDEADKFLRDHQPSELSKLRVELTRWQLLAERLATALDDCNTKLVGWHGLYPSQVGSDDEATFQAGDKALAAYESAKSGNLPDPLDEAVKRMEAVPITTLIDAYFTASDSCDDVAFNAIRARLISAAKGEQP